MSSDNRIVKTLIERSNMNVPRIQEHLSQMAQHGEAASALIDDDGRDVCRAAMDNLMLNIGIVYWLVSDHARNPHVMTGGKNGEETPPWLKEAKKSGG